MKMGRRRAAILGNRHLLIPVLASLILIGVTLVLCEEGSGGSEGTADASSKNESEPEPWNKTGIPQIDYVNDPNLPRELNGYNLSSYPFLNKVPKVLNFSCDGLKDGFYASIEYKCQLYHHCLYGTRYDFLCANYTAFDQRTFICTFVSDVDCPNSAKFFHRNDALYLTPTTTTIAPPYNHRGASSRRVRPAILQSAKDKEEAAYREKELEETEPEEGAPVAAQKKPRPQIKATDYDERRPAFRRRCGPRRGRRCRRPRPRPVYYDYDDYYDEYDTGAGAGAGGGAGAGAGRRNRYQEYDYYEEELDPPERPAKPEKKSRQTTAAPSQTTTRKTTTTTTELPPEDTDELDPERLISNREKIFSQGRVPPRIRPPVPRKVNAKSEGNGIQGRKSSPQPQPTTSTTARTPEPELEAEYEYYDDIEEAKPVVTEPPPKSKFHKSSKSSKATMTPTTTKTTTTTTTTPPPIYEYEYDDSEEEAEPTSPPTTTTYKPVKKFGPRRSQDTAVAVPVVDNHFGSGSSAIPATAHDQINSALESPSRIPSLRTPYSTRPRPNSITPGTTLPPPPTTVANNIYETRYDADYSQDADVDADGGFESSTSRQRTFWQRTPTPVAMMTSTPPLVPDYMSYQETAVPRRYGQRPVAVAVPVPAPVPVSRHEYSAREYSHPQQHQQQQQQQSSDDYYNTQGDDPRAYSHAHSVEPSYSTSTSHVTRSQSLSHRRRQPSPAEEEAQLSHVYARPSPSSSMKPQFISLMQDHEDAYYQPRAAPTQNIHVQMTPNYAISESNMMGALLSQYKPLRSGHSQSHSHSRVVSPYPVYLRPY